MPAEDAAPPVATTVALTALALTAFAANSVLTRLALGQGDIDAGAFAAVRVVTGAAMLVLLVRLRARSFAPLRGPRGVAGLAGPIALFGYVAPFSFAYLRIGAAVGALVLFGSVQLTMIGWGLAQGERPGLRTWSGLVVAAGGLVALMLPAASRPDPLGTALMVVAGVAWGAYSLLGKRVGEPLAANARAFLLGVPFALALALATGARAAPRGLVLASISGAVTSGLGYAIWYRALRGLTATRAAILQLTVPVIAALGAVALLGERPSWHLLLAGAVVLGGVALALAPVRAR